MPLIVTFKPLHPKKDLKLKTVKIFQQNDAADWKLFNLSEDRNETTDLASSQATLLDSMQQAFTAWSELVDTDGAFDYERETNKL